MKILFLALPLLCLTMDLCAADTQFQSSRSQTTLIELYTSEGCSSCPPAEAWLSGLKNDPGLWKQFVPVAFHVDYWDRLGWRDRFSSGEWTARQSRYAALWGNESVYTPAVVINGREERGWSSNDLHQPNEKAAGVLTATSADGKNFSVEFHPENGGGAGWDAHVALLGADISTNVSAGENSGRNLQHDFVVLDLQQAAMKSGRAALRIHLPSNAAAEPRSRKALAVWVTRRGELAPVQATGGWLSGQ
jgi:hypothetical protein